MVDFEKKISQSIESMNTEEEDKYVMLKKDKKYSAIGFSYDSKGESSVAKTITENT